MSTGVNWIATSIEPVSLPYSYSFMQYWVTKWDALLTDIKKNVESGEIGAAHRQYVALGEELREFSESGLQAPKGISALFVMPDFPSTGFNPISFVGGCCRGDSRAPISGDISVDEEVADDVTYSLGQIEVVPEFRDAMARIRFIFTSDPALARIAAEVAHADQILASPERAAETALQRKLSMPLEGLVKGETASALTPEEEAKEDEEDANLPAGVLTRRTKRTLAQFEKEILSVFDDVMRYYLDDKIVTSYRLLDALEAVIVRTAAGLEEGSEVDSEAVNAADKLRSTLHAWKQDPRTLMLLEKKTVTESGLALLLEDTSAELGWTVGRHAQHFSAVKIQPNNELAFRCEGLADVPIFNMMAILNESDLHKEWVPYAKRTELVTLMSRFTQIGFHEYGLPWPLENRSTFTFGFGVDMLEEPEKGVCVFAGGMGDGGYNFHGFDLPGLPTTQMILKTFAFQLTPAADPNKTYATFVASVNPQVSVVPRFVMNAGMKVLTNGMFTNILKIARSFQGTVYEKRIVEKPHIYGYLKQRVQKLHAEGASYEDSMAALHWHHLQAVFDKKARKAAIKEAKLEAKEAAKEAREQGKDKKEAKAELKAALKEASEDAIPVFVMPETVPNPVASSPALRTALITAGRLQVSPNTPSNTPSQTDVAQPSIFAAAAASNEGTAPTSAATTTDDSPAPVKQVSSKASLTAVQSAGPARKPEEVSSKQAESHNTGCCGGSRRV